MLTLHRPPDLWCSDTLSREEVGLILVVCHKLCRNLRRIARIDNTCIFLESGNTFCTIIPHWNPTSYNITFHDMKHIVVHDDLKLDRVYNLLINLPIQYDGVAHDNNV